MQYILLIHANTKSDPADAEWMDFIGRARSSGFFQGGSEIGRRESIGDTDGASLSTSVAGFMRFDSDDKPGLLDLLRHHPVVVHGGAVELCEMPKS